MASDLQKNLATAISRFRKNGSEPRALVSYEPNPLLGWAYHRFFERIQVDEAWAASVRQAEARGTVVYVLRNLSPVDFFALDYLTKRHKLPQVHFANDLGLGVLEPMGRGWAHALARDEATDVEDLRVAVSSGASAALFLKRPPTLLEGGTRGRIEGDRFLRTILDVQRQTERPILLVPQVFVWSKHGDAAKHTALDAVLGPREWPGKIRTIGQFLANYRHVTLRAGEPLDLKAFLASERTDGEDDGVFVRRMTYVLLRRLERERHAVLGPTRKPPDRMRDEVLRSPRLQKIIHDMAGEGAAERRAFARKAVAMLEELEALPDANVLTMLDGIFERTVARMYSELEVDTEGIERVREAAKEGSIVLLPSHKSHVDYMVLTYVFYHHHMQLPLIAAGDNLNFAPLGPVLRRAGAFFIRRSFKGDRLYGAVVDAYMRRLLRDRWPLEFFLEGGRSRTGKLLAPKLGLLNIVVDAALASERPTFFVPISIGYERLVEEKAYVDEVSGGEKAKEDMRGLLGSGAKVIRQRYGRLSVQFGEIMTLDRILADLDRASDRPPSTLDKVTPARRRALVTRLAYRVMNEINHVTAVTPGALVATALLTHGRRGLGYDDLIAACERLARMLHGFGARFSPSLAYPKEPGRIRLEAVREACDLFVRAGHLEARLPGGGEKRSTKLKSALPGAVYVVPDERRLSLDLAKNIVVHFFVARGLLATALGGARVPLATLRERVLSLSRLFKYEFTFRADASFDRIFDETLRGMQADGELIVDGGVRVAEPRRNEVTLYVQMLKNFVEGYRVAARSLPLLLRGPMTPKELTKKAITIGERMFLAGEIQRREAISGPVIENALSAFVDLDYVNRQEGKLDLPESYASAETVRTVEAKIAAFLERD